VFSSARLLIPCISQLKRKGNTECSTTPAGQRHELKRTGSGKTSLR